MEQAFKFLVYYGTLVAFVFFGYQLLLNKHPLAGGWLVATGILCLLFGQLRDREREEDLYSEEPDKEDEVVEVETKPSLGKTRTRSQKK